MTSKGQMELLNRTVAEGRARRLAGGGVAGSWGYEPDHEGRHLAVLVLAMHEDQHAEPAEYCTAACQEAARLA